MKKYKWKLTWINDELKMSRPNGKDAIEIRDLDWTERWMGMVYGWLRTSHNPKFRK